MESRAARPSLTYRPGAPAGNRLLSGHAGRGARSPLEIPWEGWKDIFFRVYHESFEDHVMLVAAGITFYVLLALAPALTAVVTVYGLFADAGAVMTQLSLLEGLVPVEALDTVRDQLLRLAQRDDPGLGLTLGVSLAFALWAANNGVKALVEAMNVAFEERDDRSWIRFTAVTLLATIAAMGLFMVILLVVIALPSVIALTGLQGWITNIVQWVSGIVVLMAVWLAVLALYRWGPYRRPARWRWLLPGATFAVGVGTLASVLFSWYVTQSGSYDRMYGPLGAIIAFMTWTWLLSLVLLLGAEISAEIEHQTLRDSTVGPTRPIGDRGARMADSVGISRREPLPPASHRYIAGSPARAKPQAPSRRARVQPTTQGSSAANLGALLLIALLRLAAGDVTDEHGTGAPRDRGRRPR